MRLKRLGYGDRVMIVSIYVFLILLSFTCIYPFWNGLVVSFNEGLDTAKGGVTFWPRAFTTANYEVVFGDKMLLNAFFVSVGRTVVGTFSAVFMTALLAYGLTKPYLIGRKFYMVFFIFTMYFGGGLVPTFLLVKSLGLMNNFLVFIIPSLISVWNMIVFRTFFKSLPAGLEESAQIDGCGNWGTFFRIVLPLSGPDRRDAGPVHGGRPLERLVYADDLYFQRKSDADPVRAEARAEREPDHGADERLRRRDRGADREEKPDLEGADQRDDHGRLHADHPGLSFRAEVFREKALWSVP